MLKLIGKIHYHVIEDGSYSYIEKCDANCGQPGRFDKLENAKHYLIGFFENQRDSARWTARLYTAQIRLAKRITENRLYPKP